MKIFNNEKSIIPSKLSLRFCVNLAVALIYILFFYTARLVKVRYVVGDTDIIFDHFTLFQTGDPVIIFFFCMTLAAMTVLVVLSAKSGFSAYKRLRYYSLSASIAFTAMSVARIYVFVIHYYPKYERITVGSGTYMFILLIAVILVANIDR